MLAAIPDRHGCRVMDCITISCTRFKDNPRLSYALLPQLLHPGHHVSPVFTTLLSHYRPISLGPNADAPVCLCLPRTPARPPCRADMPTAALLPRLHHVGVSTAQHQVAPVAPCSIVGSVHQKSMNTIDILGQRVHCFRFEEPFPGHIPRCSTILANNTIVSSVPERSRIPGSGCLGR